MSADSWLALAARIMVGLAFLAGIALVVSGEVAAGSMLMVFACMVGLGVMD